MQRGEEAGDTAETRSGAGWDCRTGWNAAAVDRTPRRSAGARGEDGGEARDRDDPGGRGGAQDASGGGGRRRHVGFSSMVGGLLG